MPLTINSVEAHMRSEAFQEDPIEHIQDNEYEFRAKNVKEIKTIVDLRDIPEGSHIHFVIPSAQQKPIHVYVNKDTNVKIPVFNLRRSQVVVHEPDGNTYKARNQVYVAGKYRVGDNVNGHYKFDEFEKPQTIPVGGFVAEMDENDYSPEIYCRHMAIANLLFRKPELMGTNDSWKILRNKFFDSPSQAQQLFDNNAEWESLFFDGMFASPQVCLGVIPEKIGNYFYAQFKQMEEEMKNSGSSNLKKDVMIHLLSDKEANHACYASLQIKPDHHGQQVYKVKVFDPNSSFTHMGYTTDNPTHILATKLNEWMPMVRHDEYYMANMMEVNSDFPKVSNTSAKEIKAFHLENDEFGIPEMQLLWKKPMVEHLQQMRVYPDSNKVISDGETYSSNGLPTSDYIDRLEGNN